MSRPLPSGSIFSILMVFAHSTHEMSVVSGLWSSFIGGATCDTTKSYVILPLNARCDIRKTRDGARIPCKIKAIAVEPAWMLRHDFIDRLVSGLSVRVKGIEPGMTVLSRS